MASKNHYTKMVEAGRRWADRLAERDRVTQEAMQAHLESSTPAARPADPTAKEDE